MTSRAPRIDTVRNQLTAAGMLIDKTLQVLELLHDQAYSRHSRGGEQPVVAGGGRDYALDTHGDPRARAAYRVLAEAVGPMVGPPTIACHQALTALNDGETAGTNRMHPATIGVAELAVALDAQRRRIAQGDARVRQLPQPKLAKAKRAEASEVAQLRLDKRQLQEEVDRLKTKLKRARSDHRRPVVGS